VTEQIDSRHWPIDGHVHFHRPALVTRTLDAAAANFRRMRPDRRGLLGVLLLCQTASEHVFEHLADRSSIGDWQLEPAQGEPETLFARKEGSSVAVVCGRQVRARGGLEVLALGTRHEFPDGAAFTEALDRVRASGAFAVLPWGFGKWLGKRGQMVAESLRALGPGNVAVGDNGSRLAMMATPALISASAHQGFRVLPGTDPYPFGGDYGRVGKFGFLTDAVLDEAAPWRTLRTWLESRAESPRAFGEPSGPVRFVVNQVGIQFYNRLFRSRLQ
jgi:hypothetical protein